MQNDSYFKMKMSSNIMKILGVYLNFSSKFKVEESIVNAPHASLWSKSTINAKSEVRFKQLILIRDR
jgi:hypothetical protein